MNLVSHGYVSCMGCPKPVSVNFATGLTNVRYEDPFTATNLVATLPPLVQSRATCDVRTGNADDRQRHDRTRCRTLRRGPSRTIVVAGPWKSHTGLCSRAHQSEGRASDLGTPGLLRPLVVQERRGVGRRPRLLLRLAEMRAHHSFRMTCLQGRSVNHLYVRNAYVHATARGTPLPTIPRLNTSSVRAGIPLPHPRHDHSKCCTNTSPTARKSRSNTRHRSACCS